jgi:hypothetical protein
MVIAHLCKCDATALVHAAATPLAQRRGLAVTFFRY